MRRPLALAYFATQAAAVAAWWIVLAAVPASRPMFALRNAPFSALGAFGPGDLVIVAGGSLLVVLARNSRHASWIATGVAGAVVYAAAYTMSTAIMELSAPWGAICMVPAAIGSVVAARLLVRDRSGANVSHRATS
jgi:hypothetical protein